RQHIVEQHGSVGQNDALGRRMGNIALVPQCHVLVERQHVPPHYARAARDVLAAYRIALVRHGARPFLPLTESLLHLVHIGTLQVAYLDRHLYERSGDYGERRHIVGMSVAVDDLRGDIGAVDVELPAYVILNEGRDVGEIADRTAQLPDLDVAGRSTETL